MRVLMLSKACVVGIYQRKLEEMAALDSDLELTLAVPPFWKTGRSATILEKDHTQGYTMKVLPMAFNGRFHLHFYPQLAQLIREIHPHIVHIDEEPYNFATYHATILARQNHAKTLWFSWQNLDRRYPPPFAWMERFNLRHTHYAIVGSQTSGQIWRDKGYQGPLEVIPQFGVDPVIFSPPEPPRSPDMVQIVYAGRLVPEKGVDLLVNALAKLSGAWHVTLLGNGPAEKGLRELVQTLHLEDHVTFKAHIPSTAMPDFYKTMDILVLPSRSLPNWTEQFGRVLVEAMACGVCVIGSDAGEIPHVIGDAGLIFPENHPDALRSQLQALVDSGKRRRALSNQGRRRVIERFTQTHIAQATLEVYREMLS